MTARTKFVLKDAIDTYRAVSNKEQQKLLSLVQNNLNGLKTINIGLERDKKYF